MKFHQEDTLRRIMHRVTSELGVVIARFRADCGSFSKEIVRIVDKQAESLHPAFCQRAGKMGSNREAERSEPIYE